MRVALKRDGIHRRITSPIMNPLNRLLLPIALFCLASLRANADWPTFQHDSSRVGATSEEIAAPLVSRWEFASPTAPKMAWPGEEGRSFEGYVMTNRIRFDEVFNVAIANGRVFFGSSVDGRVFCKNLQTGREEWTFFTDGPIRLAPMIADGKLFVGSDDGHAYCLDAASGRLLWQLRAGPNDERILARGRMISRWPIRTGVLVDGGIAYFGAGVFPSVSKTVPEINIFSPLSDSFDKIVFHETFPGTSFAPHQFTLGSVFAFFFIKLKMSDESSAATLPSSAGHPGF